MNSRDHFRPYALDGAQLLFHPATGTSVQIATDATRALRRTAPRVVMFGITNHCNLTCDFCSRDLTRESAWSASSAACVLRDLSVAGTLEVAFGGGEPFAFRGFTDLLDELSETTPLALNVTTNGTLIRPSTWRRGVFGHVRLSLYENTPWHDTAAFLAAENQRWGANLLIDDDALRTLPATLEQLHTLRCHDVSLLSYVGSSPRRQLSPAGETRLAHIINHSPVSCRISVCFGSRVAVPRLFKTGDCGAGLDFISITPDRRMQSCSFQDTSLSIESAADILDAWRTKQAHFARASSRIGCARATPQQARAMPPVAVWQAFSGNNSGECIMVAKFETSSDAEKYLAELMPGFDPPPPFASGWAELFAREGVATPQAEHNWEDLELTSIGRSVFAVGYDAEDSIPELRALAAKRDAFVVPGGIHEHGPITMLAAIRTDRELEAPDHITLHRHGNVVLAHLTMEQRTLAEVKAQLQTLSAGDPLAAELFFEEFTPEALLSVRQRLGHAPARKPRLLVSFWYEKPEWATDFAQSLGETWSHLALRNSVLFDSLERRKRVAVLAHRRRGRVTMLEGATLICKGHFFYPKPPVRKGLASPEQRVVDAKALERALGTSARAALQDTSWFRSVTATIVSDDPSAALTAMNTQAELLGCQLSLWVEEQEPLRWAVDRLLAEVR